MKTILKEVVSTKIPQAANHEELDIVLAEISEKSCQELKDVATPLLAPLAETEITEMNGDQIVFRRK